MTMNVLTQTLPAHIENKDNEPKSDLEEARDVIVDEICDFYNIDDEDRKDRAKQVLVLESDSPLLTDLIRQHVGIDNPKYQKHGAWLERRVEYIQQSISKTWGFRLSKNTTTRLKGDTISSELEQTVVVVRSGQKPKMREYILRHELLHEIAENPNGGTGFADQEGFDSNGTKFNEGVTQILTVALQTKKTSLEQLRQLFQNSQNVSYREFALDFLEVCIKGTPPLTLNEIADEYFSNEEDPFMKRLMLAMKLQGHVNTEEQQESLQKILGLLS